MADRRGLHLLRPRPARHRHPVSLPPGLRAPAGRAAKAVAARLGVAPRTVQRYLAGQIKRPTPCLAAALEREAGRSWQPRVRARAVRQAAQRGITVETRARFGFTSAAGSTGDPRLWRITEQLPVMFFVVLQEGRWPPGPA